MPSEKTAAIVLRVIDFSETSCVVTLYTEDFGKIAALAKGARRPKGPFESALDLLALCRIVFIRKSPGTLDLLTEARLERRFRAATRDLSRLYAGYYVLELLDALTDMGDANPPLFHAADRALRSLDGQAGAAWSLLRFELTALRVVGHLPTLQRCAGCGGQVPAAPRVAFGQLAGGLLCDACRAGQRHVVSLSARAADTLRQLASADPDRDGDAPPAGLDPPVRGELRGLMNHYLAHLLGYRPKMHPYLGQLTD